MHLGTLLIPYLPDPTPFISTVAFSSIVRLTQPRGGYSKFFLVAGLREDNVPQTSFEEAPDDYVCKSAEQLEGAGTAPTKVERPVPVVEECTIVPRAGNGR